MNKYKTDEAQHQAQLESKRKWREAHKKQIKKYNEKYYDADPEAQIERVQRLQSVGRKSSRRTSKKTSRRISRKTSRRTSNKYKKNTSRKGSRKVK